MLELPPHSAYPIFFKHNIEVAPELKGRGQEPDRGAAVICIPVPSSWMAEEEEEGEVEQGSNCGACPLVWAGDNDRWGEFL